MIYIEVVFQRKILKYRIERLTTFKLDYKSYKSVIEVFELKSGIKINTTHIVMHPVSLFFQVQAQKSEASPGWARDPSLNR